jgi:hypothetical protein
MNTFRILLVSLVVMTITYTLKTGSTYGWNFWGVAFEFLFSLNWAGQFTLDFTCFLVLTGVWIFWRNQGSLGS